MLRLILVSCRQRHSCMLCCGADKARFTLPLFTSIQNAIFSAMLIFRKKTFCDMNLGSKNARHSAILEIELHSFILGQGWVGLVGLLYILANNGGEEA